MSSELTQLPNRLLTAAETAEYLGVSVSTLAKWRLTGHGPAYSKFQNKHIRYAPADLLAFVQVNRRTSTADPGPDAQAA